MSASRLGEILVEDGAVLQAIVDEALVIQKQGGGKKRIGEILVEVGAIDPERLARALARQMGLLYVDPLATPVDPQVVWKLPRKLAERHHAFAFALDGRTVRIATPDPTNTSALQDLQFALKAPVRAEVASESRVLQAIRRHYDLEPMAQRLLGDIPPDLHGPTTAPNVMDLDAQAIAGQLRPDAQQSFIRLFNFLLVNAIERNASDIHIEPKQDAIRVRFRIDGLLREVLELPQWVSLPLVSRIKVVSRMDIAERRKPQDGRAAVDFGKRRVDLRLSVIPSQFGETVVIRLLDSATVRTDLGSLGWNPRLLAQYFHIVSQPQGLVLVAGPTGCGKSTTLYATINRLRNETSAILTVEDPIEHTIDGIAQVQVSERQGMGFSQLIRSLLRQDPDVLVIGEIRDDESALATAEAANTGHLVLSTLHTGNSIAAITRMRDMNVPAYLLGGTLQGVVAQRLVRKVCQVCSIQGRADEVEWERIGMDPMDLGDKVRRVGPGCPSCQYMGYSGRVGVYEVVTIDDNLRSAILRGAQETEMWGLARAGGLTTLLDDALDKVREGYTTLEEVAANVPIDPWRPRRRRRGSVQGMPDPATSPRPSEALRQPTHPRPVALPHAAPAIGPQPTPMAATHGTGHAPAHTEVEGLVELGSDALSELLDPAGPEVHRQPVVLAVDDAEEILTLIAATLEGTYQVEFARDGVEGLEMIERIKPDLIVLDVMMPRMTGYEVSQRLKAAPATRDLPILMLSARGDTAHVKQGFHAGADDYLPKPFDPEELELRIRALLRRAQRT